MFSREGQIPHMDVNGEHICDSNVMTAFLEEQGYVNEQTNQEEKAITHAAIRMPEEHTAQIGFYYRYALNMPAFFGGLDIANRMFEADKYSLGKMLARVWPKVQPTSTLKKTKSRGLGRHSDEELWEFSNDDLRSLSVLLGDKPYFFGKKPSLLDCAVFGHIVQFLYIPIDFPQAEFLRDECPNLVAFVERFRRILARLGRKVSATAESAHGRECQRYSATVEPGCDSVVSCGDWCNCFGRAAPALMSKRKIGTDSKAFVLLVRLAVVVMFIVQSSGCVRD